MSMTLAAQAALRLSLRSLAACPASFYAFFFGKTDTWLRNLRIASRLPENSAKKKETTKRLAAFENTHMTRKMESCLMIFSIMNFWADFPNRESNEF